MALCFPFPFVFILLFIIIYGFKCILILFLFLRVCQVTLKFILFHIHFFLGVTTLSISFLLTFEFILLCIVISGFKCTLFSLQDGIVCLDEFVHSFLYIIFGGYSTIFFYWLWCLSLLFVISSGFQCISVPILYFAIFILTTDFVFMIFLYFFYYIITYIDFISTVLPILSFHSFNLPLITLSIATLRDSFLQR